MKHTNKFVRPTSIAPDFEAIPDKLKLVDGWVLWGFIWRDDGKGPDTGKWNKVPFDAKTLSFAKTADGDTLPKAVDTWSSFAVAREAYLANRDRFDGVGVMLGAGLVGVDVDNCVTDEEGELQLSDLAQDIIDSLHSYTELTPSGTGLHILLLGDLDDGRKDSARDLEVYGRTRYFTVTGRTWHEKPLEVIGNAPALGRLMASFQSRAPKTDSKPFAYAGAGPSLESYQVLDKMFSASNGLEIRKLFYGDTSKYNDDHSAADAALCAHLAFYTGDNAQLLDTLFRQSGLYRKKWDERHSSDGSTYGEVTVRRALYTVKERYRPPQVKEVKIPPVPEPDIPDDTKPKVKRRFTVAELAEGIFEYYESEQNTGYTVGWKEMSNHWRPRRGTYTTVIGQPGDGKTTFVDAATLNMARLHKLKWAMCMLETRPLRRHLANLSHMVTGKPFFRGLNERMTRAELQAALEVLDGLFYFVEPDDENCNMESVIAITRECIEEWDTAGFVIDPYTELDQSRPSAVTENEFIRHNLNLLRRFVTKHDQVGILNVHPTKLAPDRKTGKTPVPRLYDANGSAHFANKTDFGISIYRRKDRKNRETTEVHILKVRFDELGRTGQVDFTFDGYEKRYYELGELRNNGETPGEILEDVYSNLPPDDEPF